MSSGGRNLKDPHYRSFFSKYSRGSPRLCVILRSLCPHDPLLRSLRASGGIDSLDQFRVIVV